MLFFGTRRLADLDNSNKLSLDALTGIAYQDDSQIAKLTIARAYLASLPADITPTLPAAASH